MNHGPLSSVAVFSGTSQIAFRQMGECHCVCVCVCLQWVQSETDCVTLLTGALAIASLLPLIPMSVVPLLTDVFEVFNQLVNFTHNKSGTCKFCSLNLLYCFTSVSCGFDKETASICQ